MREDLGASRTLDLLGFFCPIPIHETRAALSSMKDGGVLEVICDDPETLRDIPSLCRRMGVELLKVTENSGEYVFFISSTSGNQIEGGSGDE